MIALDESAAALLVLGLLASAGPLSREDMDSAMLSAIGWLVGAGHVVLVRCDDGTDRWALAR